MKNKWAKPGSRAEKLGLKIVENHDFKAGDTIKISGHTSPFDGEYEINNLEKPPTVLVGDKEFQPVDPETGLSLTQINQKLDTINQELEARIEQLEAQIENIDSILNL